MKQVISLIAILLIATACQQNGGKMNESKVVADQEIMPLTRQEEVTPPPPPQPKAADVPIEKEKHAKKIIKDGEIRIQVTDLESAKQKIDGAVKNNGGYYANERLYNSENETSYSLTIRIPSAQFEKFIKEIETGEGEISYKAIDARDVTDQFIDLETRLSNKLSYLTRYRELLKQAKSVKEILEIEEKIRELEEEIESTTGKLKYLNDQVDFSTVNLEIKKEKEFKYNNTGKGQFIERLKHSLSGGWYGFVDFTLFFFKIWPLWLIIAAGVWGWKKYRKKRK